MLKIWDLYVKRLQSYRSTKFENGLTRAERACIHFGCKADFFLRPPTLTAGNFEAA